MGSGMGRLPKSRRPFHVSQTQPQRSGLAALRTLGAELGARAQWIGKLVNGQWRVAIAGDAEADVGLPCGHVESTWQSSDFGPNKNSVGVFPSLWRACFLCEAVVLFVGRIASAANSRCCHLAAGVSRSGGTYDDAVLAIGNPTALAVEFASRFILEVFHEDQLGIAREYRLSQRTRHWRGGDGRAGSTRSDRGSGSRTRPSR